MQHRGNTFPQLCQWIVNDSHDSVMIQSWDQSYSGVSMRQALEYASDGIRDDPVVVLPVVKSCWWVSRLGTQVS